MSTTFEDYKRGNASLPTHYRRWHLYGAGLENVGRNGEPETVETTEPGPDEILVRHDACGICYSDIKIINLGGEHPRLVGRNLAENPVVMGHEVALTVMKVGENWKDRFHPGERYIVQADIYYNGVNIAYGYALPGGMSQYGLIGPEVLNGDEGCYLLPLNPDTGYVEAALVEPWACVEAAYHWTNRDSFREGGHVLLVGQPWDSPVEQQPTTSIGPRYTYTFWNGRGELPVPEKGFDDVVFQGAPEPDVWEKACAHLAKNAVVCLKSRDGNGLTRPVQVDVGRIHYDGHLFVGSTEDTDNIQAAYTANRRSELRGSGLCWMIGAAGPMGQMHLQRALSLPDPPRRILCTDRHDHRLDTLRERFAAKAAERGVELILFNVRTQGQPPLETIAPEGFDDIVIMVPSVEAIEESFPLLAANGVLNVFAGLARGTMAALDMNAVATKNVRIVGTSGSTIEDMRVVRDKMESGQLNTGASLAAVGGLNAFREGLEAVKTSRFPGKTVIFPHLEDLPLTGLDELAKVRPDAAAKLERGKYWSAEAEQTLLERTKDETNG
ncbi:MAG: hypothetical protein OHK0029_15630 [Armatimonadaceae bacterium]